MLRLRWGLVIGCIALGCGGEPGSLAPGPDPEHASEATGLGVRAAGVEKQGVEKQGVEKQGASLFGSDAPVDHLLSSILIDGQPVWDARVEEGELLACRQPPLKETHILARCKKPLEGGRRDCGWSYAGDGRCKPKSKVLVGAGVKGFGWADEVIVLRICDAEGGCRYEKQLAGAEKGEGAVEFFCPSSGRFHAFLGSWRSRISKPRAAAESSSGPLCQETLRGEDFLGAELTGIDGHGNEGRFTIVKVEPEDAERFLPGHYSYPVGRTFLYGLEGYNVKDEKQRTFTLCGPDAEGGRMAIPLAGTWDATWGRSPREDRFTFACTSGVLAKCYRWGYRPWLTGADDMAAVHQACTRMASADYCGDGTSHTIDGTSVDLWDRVVPQQIQRRAGGDATMQFEAGWGEYGAVCLSHLRWENLPDTLDPRLQCPHQLLDPKQSWPSQQPVPTVCDSEEEAVERFPWYLHLFNTSRENTFLER